MTAKEISKMGIEGYHCRDMKSFFRMLRTFSNIDLSKDIEIRDDIGVSSLSDTMPIKEGILYFYYFSEGWDWMESSQDIYLIKDGKLVEIENRIKEIVLSDFCFGYDLKSTLNREPSSNKEFYYYLITQDGMKLQFNKKIEIDNLDYDFFFNNRFRITHDYEYNDERDVRMIHGVSKFRLKYYKDNPFYDKNELDKSGILKIE